MSPTNQPKGRTPFIYVLLESPFASVSKVGMGHFNLVSLDVSSCIHEKSNPDAGNPEERITSRKKLKNRMESYRWMTGIYTVWQSGGWWRQVFT
jgi:hypothetical protein